jgi:hypothetical protein
VIFCSHSGRLPNPLGATKNGDWICSLANCSWGQFAAKKSKRRYTAISVASKLTAA